MARNALGRGLGAIFGEDAETLLGAALPTDNNNTESKNDILELRISMLEPNRSQPRKIFDGEKLNELADSIRQHGVLQPVLVRRAGSSYEIVAGERRWRAARLAGLKEIPVVIRELDDAASAEIALIENLQREDLDPVEEARAYRVMIERFGLKQDEVAERVSKSRTAVTNSLRLLQLDDEVLDLIEKGMLTAGHARCLIGCSADVQKSAAKKIVDENLSVRAAEKLIKNIGNKKSRKTERPEERDLYLNNLAEQLTGKLGMKVRISGNDSRGKLEIDYYSAEDLEELLNRLM